MGVIAGEAGGDSNASGVGTSVLTNGEAACENRGSIGASGTGFCSPTAGNPNPSSFRDRRFTVGSLRTDQAGFVSQDHGLDAVSQLELVQQVGDVGLNGRLADVKARGDLGVGEASRNFLHDFSLAVGEGLELL